VRLCVVIHYVMEVDPGRTRSVKMQCLKRPCEQVTVDLALVN